MAILAAVSLLSGCAFLPGFGILEDPALYVLPVGVVANQVACELQEFMSEHEKDSPANYRWRLANENASVKLTLTTDTSGYVDFTGINVAKLGLVSLATLISAQSSVPSLGAKISGKRTRTVEIDFSVSPNPLKNETSGHSGTTLVYKEPLGQGYKIQTENCKQSSFANNPVESLYLRDWLTNYFETINYTPIPGTAGGYHPSTEQPSANPTDQLARGLRQVIYPDYLPKQLKMTSVEISTTFMIAADISGGATPQVLGNGSVFILPINGLSLDFNPDYSHKIDITLNICDNLNNPDQCKAPNPSTTLLPYDPTLDEQCHAYAILSPILSSVKPQPPRDYEGKGPTCSGHCTCVKSGRYTLAKTS